MVHSHPPSRSRPRTVAHGGGKTYHLPDTTLYSGATVGSNNTAELQALIELFDYLQRIGDGVPTIIYTDSQYALDIILGLSVPSTHVELAALAQKCWLSVCTVLPVHIEKVPGHAGIEGKEIADKLALRGYTNRSKPQGRHLLIPSPSITPTCPPVSTQWFKDKTLEEKYTLLKDLLLSTAETVLTERPKQLKKPYIKDDTWQIITELHDKRNLPEHDPAEVANLRNKAKRKARQDKKTVAQG